ncbi:hypothetical protein C7N43_23790 [Sphingobacteriales bacterium UPWRP_1]|nr:hypothetical protein BVG80_05865 [Sphingobacteriales bacterium TSM_CSM]PSJ74466.1 hypothetical protein C7N43_23790 [Sphingobacteriales bacterium UPWRP_1]
MGKINKKLWFAGALCLGLLFSGMAFAQTEEQQEGRDRGQFSGDFQTNVRFYQRDSLRGAAGIPFYDYLLYGVDSWLTLNYRVAGFDMGMRFDMFHNSNLFNPTREASKQGIGRWYIAKSVGKLDLAAGYLYDQFGSGTTFRAYEARLLGVDQSVLGIKAAYHLTPNWTIRGFTGKLKNQFKLDDIEQYRPILRGACIEGLVKLNTNAQIQPGVSAVSRTLDTKTMESVAQEINSYKLEDRFEPKYSTYLASVYNTLLVKNISWYVEGAFKTEDVVRDLTGKLFNPNRGYVLYSTATYSKKGFGLVLQGKYTSKFDFRIAPSEIQNAGLVHYLPSLTRLNTYRLTSRYNAATQLLGEVALQGDITYTPKKGVTFSLNVSDIFDPDNSDQLFRELYADVSLKPKDKKWKLNTGLQMVDYNQARFEQKGDFVNTLTPFAEWVYKFDKKKSIKAELSYMLTKRNYRLFGQEDPHPDKLQDLGDFAWALLEFDIAPHWSFTVANMWNVDNDIHYPTVGVFYTLKVTRLSVIYAKQPAGIVCTGGVCRFEPAFSGMRLDIATSF